MVNYNNESLLQIYVGLNTDSITDMNTTSLPLHKQDFHTIASLLDNGSPIIIFIYFQYIKVTTNENKRPKTQSRLWELFCFLFSQKQWFDKYFFFWHCISQCLVLCLVSYSDASCGVLLSSMCQQLLVLSPAIHDVLSVSAVPHSPCQASAHIQWGK